MLACDDPYKSMYKSYAGDVNRLNAKSTWNNKNWGDSVIHRWFGEFVYNFYANRMPVLIIFVKKIVDPHVAMTQYIEIIVWRCVHGILPQKWIMRNATQFCRNRFESRPRMTQKRNGFCDICEKCFHRYWFGAIMSFQMPFEKRFILKETKFS